MTLVIRSLGRPPPGPGVDAPIPLSSANRPARSPRGVASAVLPPGAS